MKPRFKVVKGERARNSQTYEEVRDADNEKLWRQATLAVKCWGATHVLHTNTVEGSVIVRREEGHDGGWILYTKAEWDSAARADWEQFGKSITFQGRPTGAWVTVINV